jgi:hypothetical protein
MRALLTLPFAAFAAVACGGGLPDPPPDGGVGVCAETHPCEGVQGACLTVAGSTMHEDVRVAENGIANVIVDVLREEAERVAGEPIAVALLNGGAIRGGRNLGPPTFAFANEEARIGRRVCAGPVSDDDIRGWHPFANETVVMTLSGAQLRRALEAGVRTWADDALLTFGPDLLRDKGGELLHPAGLAYEITCPGTTRIRIGPSDCNPFAGTCRYLNAAAEWDFTERLVAALHARTPITLDGAQGRIRVVGTVGGLPCNLPSTCLPAHRTHPSCGHL